MSKIIIIGPAFPLRGGLATFDERLARQCISEGHETIIYTFSLQYPSFLFPGKTQYSESAPPNDLNIQVCINSINPFNWWKVGKKLKKEQADIILIRYWLPFMGPCLGSLLRLAKNNKKTKLVGLMDNVIPHEKRFGDKIFTQYVVSSLDAFITMSSFVKDDLKQFTDKSAHLVQHPLYDNFGVGIEKYEARKALNLPHQDFIFLFFGFIRHYKGLDLLIDSLEFLPSTEKNISILIAGEYYAEEAEIKNKIKSSKNKEKILEHTHFINDDEVAFYFSACDCVIQPYRHATQSGVTPLAYHFEKPMIVTNVGALPVLVPPTLGIVCEPNSTAISAAMVSMLNFDQNIFEQHIKDERKKLSWSVLTEKIISC